MNRSTCAGTAVRGMYRYLDTGIIVQCDRFFSTLYSGWLSLSR